MCSWLSNASREAGRSATSVRKHLLSFGLSFSSIARYSASLSGSGSALTICARKTWICSTLVLWDASCGVFLSACAVQVATDGCLIIVFQVVSPLGCIVTRKCRRFYSTGNNPDVTHTCRTVHARHCATRDHATRTRLCTVC